MLTAPTTIPDCVILDVQKAVWDYWMLINSIPELRHQVHNNADIVAHTVQSLLEYMADQETAKACIEECARETRDWVEDESRQNDLEEAVRHLGMMLLNEITLYKLYDDRGALWYVFYSLVGYDVMLRKVQQIDFPV